MAPSLAEFAPALLQQKGESRFYQAVEVVTDQLGAEFPAFLDRLLFEVDGEAFIPSLVFYARTGLARVVVPA